jgi:hypothetical protein
LAKEIRFTDFEPQKLDAAGIVDAGLEQGIRDALGKAEGLIAIGDVSGLSRLSIKNANIGDLTGLEYALDLVALNLSGNQIVDLEPLRGLDKLAFLDVSDNLIVDIAPLLGPKQLEELRVFGNPINFFEDSFQQVLIEQIQATGGIRVVSHILDSANVLRLEYDQATEQFDLVWPDDWVLQTSTGFTLWEDVSSESPFALPEAFGAPAFWRVCESN